MDQRKKLRHQLRAGQAEVKAAQDKISELVRVPLMTENRIREFNQARAALNDAQMNVLEILDKLRDLKN